MVFGPHSDIREDVEEFSERRVLVLYTGGTIGMMRNKDGVYEPMANTFECTLREDQKLHDSAYIEEKYGPACSLLALPKMRGFHRVLYSMKEYDMLVDSCNVTSSHWDQFAYDIYNNYQMFDGFVILHGTDTLAYTASALSFMFENLGKTIIITGSQIPIFEVRTDGVDNFIDSLIIAGNFTVPEVCVYFHKKLMRGNRTVKFSSDSLDAFFTPNTPVLANLGINIEINYSDIWTPCTFEKFTLQTNLSEDVGLLRIYPNMSLQTVRSFLDSGLKGVVLETFGSGNVVSNRFDLVSELKNAVSKGILIINCTQCSSGKVSVSYETGKVLETAGVICGFDITSEAALCKLGYVLSKSEWDVNKKKQMLSTNLRMEMTTGEEKVEKCNILHTFNEAFGFSNEEEIIDLQNVLFPSMMINAVLKNDIKKIRKLLSYGASVNATNYDLRTPLHIACSEGNYEIVNFLLINGGLVHMKDRYGKTPLMDAVFNDHHDIISLLKKTGAHFLHSSINVGEHLCKAASRGLVKRLQSYELAGVDLAIADLSGRTALHCAVLSGQVEIMQYLLSRNFPLDVKDRIGQTPLDLAEIIGNPKIQKLLNKQQAA